MGTGSNWNTLHHHQHTDVMQDSGLSVVKASHFFFAREAGDLNSYYKIRRFLEVGNQLNNF